VGRSAVRGRDRAGHPRPPAAALERAAGSVQRAHGGERAAGAGGWVHLPRGRDPLLRRRREVDVKLAWILVAIGLFAACTSPEAMRLRGQGNGGDVRNVREVT